VPAIWAFAEKRSAAASALFAARIQQRLSRCGVSLRDLVWQTDNGGKFKEIFPTGSWMPLLENVKDNYAHRDGGKTTQGHSRTNTNFPARHNGRVAFCAHSCSHHSFSSAIGLH
jgi:hypothetical protein